MNHGHRPKGEARSRSVLAFHVLVACQEIPGHDLLSIVLAARQSYR